ncbi:amidohydrolase [Amycolatopsis sp. NBC_00345]|uniref:amidohydrolase family protein n=1 Tax=Amycolatopsis sp. NBC_00345 TaxID=2975955 RepID=UPI002E2609E9
MTELGPGRIDTHTHVVPPFYADWLGSLPGYAGPRVGWSPDAALDSFDRLGVAAGILSISSPGVRFGLAESISTTRALARRVNDYCADVVRDHPRRFGFFATLVLPDLDGALSEARYALDVLGADGVVLPANVDGVYLGTPGWDPLLEFLDERNVVVFVHPTALAGPPASGLSPAVVDFLADTTRAAATLVAHDCLDRYPSIRFILAHGGGYLPYAATRVAAMLSRERDEDMVLDRLRRFYLDTALVGGPYALPSLLAFADPQRLTFGSDWPYEFRPHQSRDFTARLDAFPMADELRAAIDRRNAEVLLPRLA